jgi:hypothetical protein
MQVQATLPGGFCFLPGINIWIYQLYLFTLSRLFKYRLLNFNLIFMKKIFVLCSENGSVQCVNSLSCVWMILPSMPVFVNDKPVYARSTFFSIIGHMHVFTLRCGSLGKIKVFKCSVLNSKDLKKC